MGTTTVDDQAETRLPTTTGRQQLSATCIQLSFAPAHGWTAKVDFLTWGMHGNRDYIEGSIGTRYATTAIAEAVDLIMAAATAIGVQFPGGPGLDPYIQVEGDGDDPAVLLPLNWRSMLQQQCERLGWKSIYEVGLTPEVPACAAPPQVQ